MSNESNFSLPSDHLSKKVQNAIVRALQEEKESLFWILMKSTFKALFLSIVFIGLLYCFWNDFFSTHWIGACLLMSVSFMVGFALYDYPQPRLQVQGFWTLWVFAKLLIGLTVVMALQLVLCPHLALVHVPQSSLFSFLDVITGAYMAFGGMKACMFLCGVTFSTIGSAFAFSFVARHFSFGRFRQLALAVVIGLLSQAPIILLQIMSSHGRHYFLFWFAGSALGFTMNAALFKWVGEKVLHRKRKRSHCCENTGVLPHS